MCVSCHIQRRNINVYYKLSNLIWKIIPDRWKYKGAMLFHQQYAVHYFKPTWLFNRMTFELWMYDKGLSQRTFATCHPHHCMNSTSIVLFISVFLSVFLLSQWLMNQMSHDFLVLNSSIYCSKMTFWTLGCVSFYILWETFQFFYGPVQPRSLFRLTN